MLVYEYFGLFLTLLFNVVYQIFKQGYFLLFYIFLPNNLVITLIYVYNGCFLLRQKNTRKHLVLDACEKLNITFRTIAKNTCLQMRFVTILVLQ